jgi:HEAT repeat protein
MRYWTMSLVLILFAVVHAETQETKKKDDSGKDKVEQKEISEFAGKTYEMWRADLNFKTQTDPSKREAAMKAVLMFGLTKATDAIPEIIADLSRHGKPGKGGVTVKVDMSVRVNGIMALNTFFLHSAKGKKAPEASLVKDAIPIYKLALKDPQVIVKERAVQGLVYLGPVARDLLDEVIPLARETSTWELRKEAVPVMVMLAANDNMVGDAKAIVALKFLSQPLNENSYVVRTLAVQGLGAIGQATCLVEIKKALEDPAKDVRLAAVQALAMGPKEKGMLDLARTWDNDNQPKEVRLAAIQYYGVAGKGESLKKLRELLEHKDKEYRMQAVNTIGQMTSFIKTSPKDLTMKKLEERAGEEKDPIISTWIHAIIMNALGDVDKKHAMPIIQRINHKDKAVRLAALQIVSMTGPKIKPLAMPTVITVVDDPDLQVANAAIETLAHIYAVETIPMLEKLRDNEKARPELREAAENAIDHCRLMEAKEKSDKKTPEKK